MPFIKESLDDITEGEVVPEGEYDLKIIKAAEKESQKGNDMVALTIKIDDSDYPNAKLVGHWLLSPDGAEPDVAYIRKLEYKRFCVCFDLPFDCEVEDMVGSTGRAMLVQEEGDDGEMYNRLRLPRLPKES